MLPALLRTMPILCGFLFPQVSGLQALRFSCRRYLACAAAPGLTNAHPSLALQQTPLNVPQDKQQPLPYQSRFLDQVEFTVKKVLGKYNASDDILQLPPSERQTLGIARNLHKRLTALARNNDCRRCWLQQVHCICSKCPPLDASLPKIRRLFLLIHHKEICLAVDTARMLLASYPDTCRLVVGGIGPEYQESMAEMLDAIKMEYNCLVLFPTDNAKTFAELEDVRLNNKIDFDNSTKGERWDVIVIDGTWSQARKLYTRYIPLEADGGPSRVQLSDEAVALLATAAGEAEASRSSGHQLRRHPITWKSVSTLEAARLLLGDMADNPLETHPWDTLSTYQQIADFATRVQLGPHR